MRLDDFPTRLELALKALSISRGRLAALLGVDKSVVSRWIKGVNAPTDHNLAKLTALVAERCPGFTMLDWEAGTPRLAERLGLVEEPPGAAPPAFTLASWLPPRVLQEAVATLMERTGFLSGDPAADDARYEASMYADPFVAEGAVPPAIRDHLFRNVGPAALLAGGDAILRMPFAQSISRGPDPAIPFPD